MAKVKVESAVKSGDALPRLQVDWQAYFRAFCQEHGEPQEVNGLLLFPDGWAYSAVDYKGPEHPPPQDEGQLRWLRRAYWLARKREVRAALARARHELKYWLEQVQARPLLLRAVDMPGREELHTPLHATSVGKRLDDEGKARAVLHRSAETAADIEARWNARIADLEDMEAQCTLELREFKRDEQEQRPAAPAAAR